MITKYEIIDTIARERIVETMVEHIAHRTLCDDLQDLSQMVYVILLEYDDDKIFDLWGNNQIRFFLARIIINQFKSKTSPFHKIYRKIQEKGCDISAIDLIDESYED